MKACCENCRFWKYLGDKENTYPSGLCRRYAPHPELRDDDGDSVMEVAWPDTDGSDWCGEWQPKQVSG